MPPLEGMSSKIIPSILTEPSEVDILVSEGIANEDAVMEQVAAIRVQEGIFSTEDYLVEPKTGLKFPVSLSPIGYKGLNDGSLNQVLVGVGARSVNIMKFSLLKIYAFGFYLKPESLRAELGFKYRGVPPEELMLRTSFYEDLLRHELDMTVRLIVHHKRIRNGLVKSTFETALRNRLRRQMKSNDEEGVRQFGAYFTEELTLHAGTVIDFHWQPGGQFHTKVADCFLGTIQSLDFCRAFFDIYIGELPVCSKAKQEIGFKLAHMLRDGS